MKKPETGGINYRPTTIRPKANEKVIDLNPISPQMISINRNQPTRLFSE
jgi:hypothetical protein